MKNLNIFGFNLTCMGGRGHKKTIQKWGLPNARYDFKATPLMCNANLYVEAPCGVSTPWHSDS